MNWIDDQFAQLNKKNIRAQVGRVAGGSGATVRETRAKRLKEREMRLQSIDLATFFWMRCDPDRIRLFFLRGVLTGSKSD